MTLWNGGYFRCLGNHIFAGAVPDEGHLLQIYLLWITNGNLTSNEKDKNERIHHSKTHLALGRNKIVENTGDIDDEMALIWFCI